MFALLIARFRGRRKLEMKCLIMLLSTMLAVTAARAMARGAEASSNMVLPGCQETCGNVSIPYPFGMGEGCYREGFKVTCNGTKLFLKEYSDSVEILDISLLQGQIRVLKFIAFACYNETSLQSYFSAPINLSTLPDFRFSNTHNKFTAIGCRTFAFITDLTNFVGGCLSFCGTLNSATNGSCTGMGCCQTSIPKNLTYYEVAFDTSLNNTNVTVFNPCSYAFLGEESFFQFDTSDLSASFRTRNQRGVPLVLDWAIRNGTCDACVSENSVCVNSSNGPGYLCNCDAGYQGNPYINAGCQDTNECDFPDKFPCYGECRNTRGNYTCRCPSGYRGDPYLNGGCDPRFPLLLKLVVAISASIITLLVTTFCIYTARQRRKHIRDKQKFFEQNGGELLYNEMRKAKGIVFKIFKEEELEKATNKFDKAMELGQGGHGTVYEGYLDGLGRIAIKKAKFVDENQKQEFVNEMVILSQINHRNVVKLLGCCLEVKVPMLVYEFVSNGTLFHHIHPRNNREPMPFHTRLRVATESAEALAYLHSSASPPIIHGDVKSSNILLDGNFLAKVADFGASVLAPTDNAQFAELIQGTGGYLDPECLQTRMLTEKSDVYSFGVVLLELITGKKALYFEGLSKDVKCLALAFLSAMRNGKLETILDRRVKDEAGMELIEDLAELASLCLSVKGTERPTMKEVAIKLQGLREFGQHPWGVKDREENESLLMASSSYYTTESIDFSATTTETKHGFRVETGR